MPLRPASAYQPGEVLSAGGSPSGLTATDVQKKRWSLAAAWYRDAPLPGIGAAFGKVFLAISEAGLPIKVDFTDKAQFAATIVWDKVGIGTHTVRVIDADNAGNVLFSQNVTTGENDVGATALPGWASGVKKLIVEAKSTTAADSPTFHGLSVVLK